MIAHRAFFGDRDRDFALSPELIMELEKVTGAGIGALSRRVIAGQFQYRDLSETIRLGLVGGGETPERAAELVKVYVAGQPLNGAHALAVAILSALWFGTAKEGSTDDN
jgi:hypothetical protein